ncbi:MAG: ABC transporter permease [Roseiflexaceae bacterium]
MAEINPVLMKDLRGRMRGAPAFLLLTLYLGILSAMALLVYVGVSDSAASDPNAGQRIGESLLYLITGVSLVQVCLITPLLTAGSIAGERERQTYDLLISSLLTPWQIVWGKLSAALAYAGLLVLGVIPLLSIAFLFGGVSPVEVLIVLAGLLASAVLYACVGLFWSALLRSTVMAGALSLATVLSVQLGIPFLGLIASLVFGPLTALWSGSAPLVYLAGLLLCLHPFLSLYQTDVFLRTDQGLFYLFWDLPSGGRLLLPSPWLGFVVLALLLSAGLLLLTVRLVRPDAPPTGNRPARPAPAKADMV